MTLWSLLLSYCGICPHEARYLELRSGVLHLVCDRCEDAVKAISREASWVPSGQSQPIVTKVPKPRSSGKVTSMRERRVK